MPTLVPAVPAPRPQPPREGSLRSAAVTAWLSVTLGLAVGCGPTSTAPDASSESLSFPGAHLLVISIDTLRADRLGCYGYARDTTPHLDAFAAESVLFEDMYSNSPKTASSHMSLFTSLLPTVHKVRNQSAVRGLESPRLPRNRLTLPQLLARQGYWNACVASGGNLHPALGFRRGFEGRFESALVDVRDTVQRTLERLDEMQRQPQPGFVFAHTYQVHSPYLPADEWRSRFASRLRSTLAPRIAAHAQLPFEEQWAAAGRASGGVPAYWDGVEDFGVDEARDLSDLYDGEIAYTDEHIGRLLDQLEVRDLLDDTIVVVLSDHGEEFFEHGEFQHDQLFAEHLRVPCIVRLPGAALAGTRVSGMASLIDLMPTLLELLELEGPTLVQGTSLVPAMLSGRTDDRPIVAERVMFPDDYEATLRSSSATLIFHARDGRLSAYDLAADAAETKDVVGEAPFVAAARDELRRSLAEAFGLLAALDDADAGDTVTLDDPELLAELEALGYVGSAADPAAVPDGTPLDRWPDAPSAIIDSDR